MLRSLRVNLWRTIAPKHKTGTLRFAVYRPGGNDTGLISGVIRDAQHKKNIAAALLEQYSSIEQVGFVNNDPKNAELMMAGGEFCGNATSSAAFQILQGKPGTIDIKVSGVKNKLRAGVTPSGDGFSQMPIYSDPSAIAIDTNNPQNALVSLEGITHYIDFDIAQIRGLTIDEIKAKARAKMAELGIDRHVCCGIIYVDQREDRCAIHPIVYVRDIDTLYYETACGSGTTALGQVLAYTSGRSIIEKPILQPSGMSIKVTVKFDRKVFTYAQIQSSVEKLHEGVLELAHETKRPLYMIATSRKILHSIIRN